MGCTLRVKLSLGAGDDSACFGVGLGFEIFLVKIRKDINFANQNTGN